jgi:hypothetical protein
MSEKLRKGDYVEILSSEMCGVIRNVRGDEALVGGHIFDVAWRPVSGLRLIRRKEAREPLPTPLTARRAG